MGNSWKSMGIRGNLWEFMESPWEIYGESMEMHGKFMESSWKYVEIHGKVSVGSSWQISLGILGIQVNQPFECVVTHSETVLRLDVAKQTERPLNLSGRTDYSAWKYIINFNMLGLETATEAVEQTDCNTRAHKNSSTSMRIHGKSMGNSWKIHVHFMENSCKIHGNDFAIFKNSW